MRVAAFSISNDELYVLLDRRDGIQQLPRSAPSRLESIDLLARQSLRSHLGVAEQYMEQLYTLTVVEEGVWRIVVSYVALVGRSEGLVAVGVRPLAACRRARSAQHR